MTKNIDKIKISLGNEVFNHISSLNKSQLEKQLSELKSELSLADKKSQRYDKLKDEEWYILYRLEKTNDFKYETGGGFSSFMSNVKSLRKTGLSKTKEAYGKTKEYVKGKVHDQKKKIALDVIYDAKENLPIKREEIKALDKAFRVVEEKYAKGGGVEINSSLSEQKKWSDKQNKMYDYYVNHSNDLIDIKEDLKKAKNRNDKDEVKRLEIKKKNLESSIRFIKDNFYKYSNGGGVGVKKNELQKGYVALKSYWKVASKPSKLKEVPTTTISSIDRDAVINYLNSLEVISEYLEGNVPYTNPDVGYGPIEENYLLYDKEEGDIYFIDTQGYNYPRYITRLAGYKPKSSEEFKLGGGVNDTKYQKLKSLIENKKYNEAVDYYLNNANITSDFVGSDVWAKLKKENNFKEFEKRYNNDDRVGMHHDSYAKGGGVGDTNWVVEFHGKKNNQTKVVRVNAKNNSDAIDKAFRKLSDMGENTDEYSVWYSHKSNYSNGGGIKWEMNWNSFTINNIRQWMKQHNIEDISVELGSKGYHKYDYKKDDNKKLYFDKSLDLRSGQENMYFDIIVTDDNNKDWIVSFFTKENRRGLKKIAKSIVDIYEKGGSVGSQFEYTIGGL